MLPKANRLKTKKELQSVFSYGKTARLGPFTVRFLRNKERGGRFAFAVPRATSKKAVIRNRIRRRMRYIVRKHLLSSNSQFDAIIAAYKGADVMTFRDMEALLLELFKKIGILA